MQSTVGLASPIVSEELRALVRQQVEEVLSAQQAGQKQRPKKMAIICSKGTLDWAYPPLILSTTAAAYGWDVGIFFTFYGLNLIHRKKLKGLKMVPLGNPALPMPIPNLVATLPGMTFLATKMMKWMFKQHGLSPVDELLQLAVDSGVKLFPCGTTLNTFGYKPEDFIPGVQPISGSASFVSYASDADVTLFI